MPVNTNFQVPFIPQEGITSQILAAIQAANEQAYRQRQLGIEQQQVGIQQQQANTLQQQANTAQARSEAEVKESAARVGLLGTEEKKNQLQIDQMRENQQFFSGSPAPVSAASAGAWIPSNTPQQVAPLIGSMLPQNLTSDERNVIEAASQAGAAKATKLGGTKADYLEELRSGIDSVITARNQKMKPEGERQLGPDDIDQINQGFAQRWNVANPGKPIPAAFVLKPGTTQKQADRIGEIFKGTETAQQTKQQNQASLDIRNQLLGLQEQAVGRKDRDFIDKNYVEPANQTEKSYQMFMDAYNNRNDAKTGAESMLALSTHLATTFGNVKGSRVTKDMIQEHLGARSVSDNAQVAIQKLTNGDVLSSDQWEAFKGLITQSRNLSWQTVQKEAKRRDVDVSGSLPADLSGGRSTADPLGIR